MRKLLVTTFLTLDGVMQAPGGPEEDETGNFELGGWSVRHFDDKVGAFMDNTMGHDFDLLLGRKTYDIFAAYWPTASVEDGAEPLNKATKYVASRSPRKLDWKTSVLLDGNVPEQVAALKQEDGPELQVHGSGNLVQTLLKHDLIDEFRVLVFPVVIGSGKRLFADGAIPKQLKLVESTVSDSGVMMGIYHLIGDVSTGTFGK